jgi:hypothetical protein
MFLRDSPSSTSRARAARRNARGFTRSIYALTRRNRRCPTQQTPNAAETRQPRRSPVLRTGQLQESDSLVSVADLSAIRSLKLLGLAAELFGSPGVLDLLGVDLVGRCRECLLTAGRWVAVCRVSWSGLPTTMRSCRPARRAALEVRIELGTLATSVGNRRWGTCQTLSHARRR